MHKYKNCISLGWFCGTASAMQMLGLRCFSGPFDWYFSDFDSVLKVIENDFGDFMSPKNLQVIDDNPKVFYDKKYGFRCNHDISCNFEIEYPSIYEKYNRRAIRFMQEVKQPTCFLRAVRSNREIAYINQNKDYIYSVIKKGNPNNEIIFLLLNDMDELSDDFIWFRLGIERYIGKEYEMFTMFSGSEKLLKYCGSNILSEIQIEENKKYIPFSRVARAYVDHCIEKNDNSIELILKEHFLTSGHEIYLFGAGMYGIRILDYLKNREIQVKAIIDNDNGKVGTIINEIPVISFSEIQKHDDMTIFITIDSKKMVDTVIEQIHSYSSNVNIITFKVLFEFRINKRPSSLKMADDFNGLN